MSDATWHMERYVLDELYLDAAAGEAHRKTPHYQPYLAKIPELADRTAWVWRPWRSGNRPASRIPGSD